MTMTINEHEQAEALWADLRSALVNFEQALARVIETKAWEPLGYDTFAQAWADRMRGTRLGTAASAATVVYALIDSGMDRDEALLTLGPSSGVGPERFDVLARQKENGVPPELATTHVRSSTPGRSVVREHEREAPSEPHVVRVTLTPDEYRHFKAVAERRGLDLATEARSALVAHFARLEKRGATDA